MKSKIMAFCIGLMPLFVHAADWQPTKPIKAFSPFTAGSANDISLRITSIEVQKLTGAEIIVDVKPGAGGSLVNDFINKQKPDGYTVSASSIPALGATDKLTLANRDFTAKDFSYAINIASIPMTIVAYPSDPVNNIKDFAKVMKSEPVTIGDPGAAARLVYELCAEYIGFIEDPKNVVRVEYKGPADTLRDVIGKQVRFGIMPLTVSQPAHAAGKVKIIAVTSEHELKTIPGVKTASYAYPEFIFNLEVVLTLAPNTPKEIIDWYVTNYNKALSNPAVVESLEKNQMFVNKKLLNSKDTTNYILSYEKRYAKIVDKILASQK